MSALVEFHTRCRACTACGLAATRTHVVVAERGSGRVAVVGEAPGADEDLAGRPFVGRSGQLLDRLLLAAGLPRGSVHVLNTARCRPPGNRVPTAAEQAACRPWLVQEVALLDPVLLVGLGLSASRALLPVADRRAPLRALRGIARPARADLGGRPVLATWHPSAVLRAGGGGRPGEELLADLRVAAQLAGAA